MVNIRNICYIQDKFCFIEEGVIQFYVYSKIIILVCNCFKIEQFIIINF